MTFYLFAGDRYYPAGGALDFRGTFDSLEAAEAAADGNERYDWAHVAAVTPTGVKILCSRSDGNIDTGWYIETEG